MTAAHKPSGYNSVSPYLIVAGAARTIDFVTRVFDAVEIRRFPDGAGKVMHAEVRIDDTVVMIADGPRAGHRSLLTSTFTSRTSMLLIVVPSKRERHRCRSR